MSAYNNSYFVRRGLFQKNHGSDKDTDAIEDDNDEDEDEEEFMITKDQEVHGEKDKDHVDNTRVPLGN